MEPVSISHSHTSYYRGRTDIDQTKFLFLISPGKKKPMMIQEEPFLYEVSYY